MQVGYLSLNKDENSNIKHLKEVQSAKGMKKSLSCHLFELFCPNDSWRCLKTFFVFWKDATPCCVTAVPLCTFPSKAAIQHAPCLLPSYKNSFERNAFAWIESLLTWEVELADPVADTAKEDDPGNCRCPCVTGRPLNQVIWLTVFAAICFGLLWSGHKRLHQKLRCRAYVGGLSHYRHRVLKCLPASDLWREKLGWTLRNSVCLLN